MRTKLLSVLALAAVVLASAGVSRAGLEPTPFRLLTIRLHRIGFALENIDGSLSDILDRPPPDDGKPFLLALLTLRLNAMADRVGTLDGRVEAILTQPPPDDNRPAYYVAAGMRVRDAAQSIAERAGEGFLHPPDPCHPALQRALAEIQSAAQALVQTVDEHLEPRPLPLPS
jgi:hypothetical protein